MKGKMVVLAAVAGLAGCVGDTKPSCISDEATSGLDQVMVDPIEPMPSELSITFSRQRETPNKNDTSCLAHMIIEKGKHKVNVPIRFTVSEVKSKKDGYYYETHLDRERATKQDMQLWMLLSKLHQKRG